MRYDERDEESRNVEDRRGERGSGGFSFPGSGGGMPFPMPGSGGGRGGFSLTTLLIVGAIMLLFGFNPLDLLRGAAPSGGPSLPQQGPMEAPRREASRQPGPQGGQGGPFSFPDLPRGGSGQAGSADDMRRFVARVLKDTEDVWNQVFQSFGRQYEEPRLVIFSGATKTACGRGLSAMGPFYCPLDRKIYIDLNFFEELKRRFRAPGDFAQAYVISHEVGHHVQTLLGIAERVQNLRARMSEREGNAVQVRMELQADCLAGVWAALTHQIKNRLEPGDIEEGLRAATAIGDDMIQKQTQGYVVPESFTHGTSEQRVRWFRRGLEAGRMQACDTFNATQL
jgi:predicted metalloprotease